MSDSSEVIEKIKAIIQVIEQAKVPEGIVIKGCKGVKVIDNVLINCGISVKDSEEIVIFANRVDDSRRREVLNLLHELINLLAHQPLNKSRIAEVLNRIKQIAEPVYIVLVTIEAIKTLLGL